MVIAIEAWFVRVPDPGLPGAVEGWLAEGLSLWEGDFIALGEAIKAASHAALFAAPTRATRLARALIRLGEREGEVRLVALGEMALGDGLRLQDRLEVGYPLLERAAERFLSIGDEVGWARTRIGWLGSLHHYGWGESVETVVRRAESIFVKHEAWAWLASLCNNAAAYCQATGQLEAQARWSARARDVAEKVPDAGARHYNLLIAAGLLLDACNDRGRFEEAHAVIGAITPLLGGMQRVAPRLFIDFLLRAGRFYQNIGWYARGLHYFYRARRAIREGQATFWELERLVLLYIATSYWQLNRYAEAEQLLEEMLREEGRDGQASLIASEARIILAEVLGAQGQYGAALLPLNEAISFQESLPTASALWLSQAYRLRVLLLHRSGAPPPEETLERALQWSEESGSKEALSQACLLQAEVATETTAREAALSRALNVCEGLPWLQWRVYHLVARHAPDEDSRRAALEKAAATLDVVQSGLATTFRSEYMVEARGVYDALIAMYLAGNEIELAWQCVERTKSRALFASMLRATREAPSGDAPLRRERERLSLRYARLLEEADRGTYSRETLRVLEWELIALHEAIDIERHGRREAMTSPSPAVPVAPEDSDLIGYYLVGEQVHAFVHNGRDYYYRRLPATEQRLAHLLDALYLNMQTVAGAPDEWTPALHDRANRTLGALDTLLLAPLRPFLRHDRLVVVPFGFLHELPFSILRHDGAYLMERCTVRLAPTAHLLVHKAGGFPVAKERSVVISHSDSGRLRGVLEEGRRVASLLGDVQLLEEASATRERVWEAMREARILHIAAHGEHRVDAPHLSSIRLADGTMTVGDLFDLSFAPSLVTLSACDSGRAVVQEGDEPVGLVRGFLAAGARSLLVTAWPLEDRSALELMQAYYRAVLSGVPRAAALREVQAAWVASARGRWRHPFYWGGLRLVGDDGPLA